MKIKKQKTLEKIILLLLSLIMLSGCSIFDFGIASGVVGGSDVPITGEDIDKPLLSAAAKDNIFSLSYDPDKPLHPFTTSSAINLYLAPLMYEALFELDEKYIAAPSRLISKYYSEDGGKSWRIYINTDIIMHDGERLTAKDVDYSIKRAQRSDRFKNRLAGIIGVGAYGDDLVIITLTDPNNRFIARLDIPIVRADSAEQYAPAGSGPYMYYEDDTSLIAFSVYPDIEKFPLKTIHLKSFTGAEEKIAAFEDSLIDLVVNDPNGLANLGYGIGNIIQSFQTTNMHYIGFNTKNSVFFMSAANRHAITYLINRDNIVTKLMGGAGLAATLPISPVSPLYNNILAARYAFAPEKCSAALKNNGVEDFDGDGSLEYMITGIPVRVNISFIVNNESAVKVSAARDLAERMRNLGMNVTLRELPWDEYIRVLKSGDFDMYYAETKLTSDFDLEALLESGGALNYGAYDDGACKNRITDYLTATDDDLVMTAELMSQYIIENAPIIPIAFEKQQIITHRGIVYGMTPTQDNIFHNFQSWTIKVGE